MEKLIKAVIVKDENDLPIDFCEIKAFTDTNKVDKFVNTINENKSLKKAGNDALLLRVAELEKKVLVLSLETQYLRGLITTEEYENAKKEIKL